MNIKRLVDDNIIFAKQIIRQKQNKWTIYSLVWVCLLLLIMYWKIPKYRKDSKTDNKKKRIFFLLFGNKAYPIEIISIMMVMLIIFFLSLIDQWMGKKIDLFSIGKKQKQERNISNISLFYLINIDYLSIWLSIGIENNRYSTTIIIMKMKSGPNKTKRKTKIIDCQLHNVFFLFLFFYLSKENIHYFHHSLIKWDW